MIKKTLIITILVCCYISAIAQSKLKVGIVPFKSDEKVLATYEPILGAIAKEVGQRADVNLVEESDLAFYLSKGKYDIGIFTVFPYLKEKHDFQNLEVFATHEIQSKDFFKGSILTNLDSDINSIQDLKGKKILFVKPTSTSGFKYPKGILTEFDIDIETELTYDFSGGHEEAIIALANRECDAIAIDETRFAKIDSFEKSDFKELIGYDVPYHAYVLSPNLPEEKKASIIETFATAHHNPELKTLWDNPLGIDKFIIKNDDYYNPIRRYLRIIRIKPSVKIAVNASDKAMLKLEDKGDILSIIERRTKRRISDSKRFSNKPSENTKYKMNIDLAYAGRVFSYQIMINDELITDGDVIADSLGSMIPFIASEALLKAGKIETNLLTNGDKWFITYGLKDGLNREDYTFEFYNKDKDKVVLNGNDLLEMNEMNIVFADHNSFEPNMPMSINYIKQAHVIPVVKPGRIFNIFRKEFYEQDFMDMALALFGTFFGISVFLYTTLFTRRKKKRFKNILYSTNELIKSFVEGQYEIETKLIEQKESIRTALESGNINENQFMILNHRLEELEGMFTYRKLEKRPVSEEEVTEIAEIVKDGAVTEREFTRIMKILKSKKTGTDS